MDLKTKLTEYNETLKDWHSRISVEDMVLKAAVGNINKDLTQILKEAETSENQTLNIANVSGSFFCNNCNDGEKLLPNSKCLECGINSLKIKGV